LIQDVLKYKSLGVSQLLLDLEWILNSHNLLLSAMPEFEGMWLENMRLLLDEHSLENWLTKLKTDSSELAEFFLLEEQFILGKYFEKLLTFFFMHYPQFEIIESGKQLFEDQQTIGEIDFIIFDKLHQQKIHLEVAVKYYMGFKDVGKHDLWIGPNGSDTLQKKVIKLQKQLKLSELGAIETDEKMALMLGYLFKHRKASQWPYFVNYSDDFGIWLYADEMLDFWEPDAAYCIMPKARWLGFYIDERDSLIEGNSISAVVEEQLEKIGKGIMVARVDPLNLKLIQKILVAPAKWPRL
jgi:hypothetical protein